MMQAIDVEREIKVRTGRLARAYAAWRAGMKIVSNVYVGSKKAQASEIDEIIAEIHRLRFNPANPYLISGDHFTQLYIRSLGIFYHSILDPRTALSDEDWVNRQKIVVKTLKFALEVFKKTPKLTTTIAPISEKAVTPINIFTPPSDSLYSLLYALKTLLSTTEITNIYPYKIKQKKLETVEVAQQILNDHKENLTFLLDDYTKQVFDKQLGLIKKDIQLSGAKDSTKRFSAFYDNVIFWKTHKLAQELKLESKGEFDIDVYRQHVLDNFWLKAEGYFLEDLSLRGVKFKHYSSDWLIALMTGFLNPSQKVDRVYLERSITYVKKHKLDLPFPLRYQAINRRRTTRLPVRVLLPSYMGKAIWSNWGMEYIKLLILMYQNTKNFEYLLDARRHLNSYSQNILKYRGYPEVYSTRGKLLSNTFYKSVRRTGWVVSYEQARAMLTCLNVKVSI